jgi:hypothetical protein
LDRDYRLLLGGLALTMDAGLAREPPAQTKHALLELTAFLDAEVRVTQIILQALQARVVSLKVVRLRQLLLFGGWVRGCARIFGVHSLSSKPFCGPAAGRCELRGGVSIYTTILAFYWYFTSH